MAQGPRLQPNYAPVPYQHARARLLQDARKIDQLQWLVTVGYYWADRWAAEDQAIGTGQYTEAAALAARDQYTEDQFDEARANAILAIKSYFDEPPPRPWWRTAPWWIIQTMGEGVVGALGVALAFLLALAISSALREEAVGYLHRAGQIIGGS